MAGVLDWFVTDLARPLTDIENAPVYKARGTTAFVSCILSCAVVGCCAVFFTIGFSMLFGFILQNSVATGPSRLFEEPVSQPDTRM